MTKHLTFDMLSRMAERGLAPQEEAQASRHLARCGRCRSELAWLERLRARPPYFSQPDTDLFGASRPQTARRVQRELPEGDWDGGAWRINRAWLTGLNEPTMPGWQGTAS